ncbi:50S ribosomal protein L28 [endosymbiont of Pachyrhynchus infernalis]|uniref:50S ribosomal protein L28 n=1 Tax=endosymbiont of Pachyrhynchus infernalis TaxID=1971488 RepID=UPI000DC6EA9A|nr:50S ribosomal protein L28 [endosymbiont of Pachyrhynchus infernalis]BBA84940.1 50S ribosomal protein L28 [endosymbiont of Pachyrhynchus infernalis]
MLKCIITNKKVLFGNNRSNAMNATRRKFFPNIHMKKFWIPSKNKYIKLKISTKGIRLIDKFGIENLLKKFKIKY